MYVVLGVIATALEKSACCHPDEVSPVNCVHASSVPVLLYNSATCVPLSLAESFQKRMPVIWPAESDRIFTPSVTGLSGVHRSFGATVVQIEVPPDTLALNDAVGAKDTSTQ